MTPPNFASAFLAEVEEAAGIALSRAAGIGFTIVAVTAQVARCDLNDMVFLSVLGYFLVALFITAVAVGALTVSAQRKVALHIAQVTEEYGAITALTEFARSYHRMIPAFYALAFILGGLSAWWSHTLLFPLLCQ